MVRISAPSACTANMVQDFTDLPSRSTVQAPQWLVSQPICGAGEAQLLAQEMDQQGARLDQRLDRAAVDGQLAHLGLGHVIAPQ